MDRRAPEIDDLFRGAAAMSASCGTGRLPMSSLEGPKTRAIFFARRDGAPEAPPPAPTVRLFHRRVTIE